MTGEQVTGSEFSGGEVKETIRKEKNLLLDLEAKR